MKHAKVTLDGKELSPTYPNTVLGDDGLPLESDEFSCWSINVGDNGGGGAFTLNLVASFDSFIELRNEDFISPIEVGFHLHPQLKVESSIVQHCGMFGKVRISNAHLDTCKLNNTTIISPGEERLYTDCYFVDSVLEATILTAPASVRGSRLVNASLLTDKPYVKSRGDEGRRPISVEDSALVNVDIWTVSESEITVVSSQLHECSFLFHYGFTAIDQRIQGVAFGGNSFALENVFDFSTVFSSDCKLYLYKTITCFEATLVLPDGLFEMITTSADFWVDHLQGMLERHGLGEYFDFARDSILSRIKVIQTIKRNKENHEQQKE